jgi:hypothetical protein
MPTEIVSISPIERSTSHSLGATSTDFVAIPHIVDSEPATKFVVIDKKMVGIANRLVEADNFPVDIALQNLDFAHRPDRHRLFLTRHRQ